MSKTKRIITIVALSLVGILVVTTIILACLPKNHYDVVFASTSDTAEHITVCRNGKGNSYSANSEQYNKIVELYKKGIKENLLLSMFEGTTNAKPEIQEHSTVVELNSSVNSYIMFSYNTTQTLMFKGQEYKDTNNNSVTFNSIVIALTNEANVMQPVNVYICSSYTDTTATPVCKITTVAKQYDLIKYVNSLELVSL